MKMLICALALAVCLVENVFAQNGAVPAKNVVITGSISVTPGDPSKGFTVIPFTKTNLLKYFGPEGVKAADTAYYTTPTGSALYLASKDGTTVYVTVQGAGSDGSLSALVTAKNSRKLRVFGQCTFCNETFTGYGIINATVPEKPATQLTTVKGQYTASGASPTDGGTSAVLSVSISYQAKLPSLVGG